MSWTTLYRAAINWQCDHASYLGAALAYYALFSIAPLLLLVLAVTGIVYGPSAAEGKLVDTLAEHVGTDTARTLQELVHQAQSGSGWAAVIGAFLLLFTALNLFLQMRTALHIIWKIPPQQAPLLSGTLRTYLLALAILLLVLLFAILVFAGSTVVTFSLEMGGTSLVTWPIAYRVGNVVLSLLLQTLALVFLFRLLSEGKIAYRHLWGGALVTAILFFLGKWLFAFYLAGTAVRTAYGAAGSLVIFLVWVYYSAQLIFFGAEVVQVQRQQP